MIFGGFNIIIWYMVCNDVRRKFHVFSCMDNNYILKSRIRVLTLKIFLDMIGEY